jgi:hypothetical protein
LLEFCLKSIKYDEDSFSLSFISKIEIINLYYSNTNIKINSNILFNKYTKEYKESYNLTKEQKEAIVGIILGDGYLERRKTTHNTRLRIEQAYPEKESYLYSLFELFKSLTSSNPRILERKADKRTGKIYKSLYFTTLRMSCLNYYYELFYANYIKKVPINIHELLTAKGLAY